MKRSGGRYPVAWLILLSLIGIGVAVSVHQSPADPKGCRPGGRFACPTTSTSSTTSTTVATTTTQPTTTTTGTGVDPSGVPLPTSAPPGCAGAPLWADNFPYSVPLGGFTSAGYPATGWAAYDDGWPDTHQQDYLAGRKSTQGGNYWPSKVVSIAGGLMRLHVHTENGVHMVAAPEPNNGQAQLYGCISYRFRISLLPRYKTAWLSWPSSGVWPRDGEIDYPEGNLDGSPIFGFLHHQGATSGGDQSVCNTGVPEAGSGWHTATTVWTATRVDFVLDGTTRCSFTASSTVRIPNTPMRWVTQTESVLEDVEPLDSTSGDVEIDWVAVWRAA